MEQHLWPPILALAIPLLALLIPIVFIVSRYALKSRKARLLHESIRHFAQLGLPIPPELLQQEPVNAAPVTLTQKSERIAGLLRKAVLAMCTGLGLGLVVYLVNLDNGEFNGFHGWAWGLLPFILGLGWLFLWRVESRQLQREQALTHTDPS
ncbi:MAG: hypothetical protein RJB14_2155 [Pseudomonadota bacterium]|jgi:hypothetical protein